MECVDTAKNATDTARNATDLMLGASLSSCWIKPRAFFKKLPVGGGGGVHKGPFGYDQRHQKIVGYADIVSTFIIE